MTAPGVITVVVVAIVIVFQLYISWRNWKRMREYRRIFENKSSWCVCRDWQTNMVNGIDGKGNDVFCSIRDSIDKYLRAMSCSVIDFQILKDSVDRHCDSVEEEVNSLTPMPLYAGLAGTMVGVILGLFNLEIQDVVDNGNIGGVEHLLSGVMMAMVASALGIVLTTAISYYFRNWKAEGERGKNEFLVWLQSELLPELPSDMSSAMNNLVSNLNTFNETFAKNTASLGEKIRTVNAVYGQQAQVLRYLHDMDVAKMASANVMVLKELDACTSKLSLFNDYLDSVKGYTDRIERFTKLFEQEADRINVLEAVKESLNDVRDYFNRHKEEIVQNQAELSTALSDALENIKHGTVDGATDLKNSIADIGFKLKDSVGDSIDAMKEEAESGNSVLNEVFVKQSEEFKRILEKEMVDFRMMSAAIRAQFENQLQHMPNLERQLEAISAIPGKLDQLVVQMQRSNAALSSNVSAVMRQTSDKIAEDVQSSRRAKRSNSPSRFSNVVNKLKFWKK